MKADLAKLEVVTSIEDSPMPIRCHNGFEVKNATVVAPNCDCTQL